MTRILLPIVCLLLVSSLLLGASFLFISLDRKSGDNQIHTIVIPPKTSLSTIAFLLEKNKVLSSHIPFKLWGYILSPFISLKAGEYELIPPHRISNILLKLHRGERIIRRFTLVEGMTTEEVVIRLREDASLEGDCSIPEEGTLLPETYHYSFGDKRCDLLKRMNHAFAKEIEKLWQSRSASLPYKSIQEAVTLASLVEKETSLPEERARVSAVFLNRLKRGMPLQCDATVLYGLYQEKGLALNRHLSRVELKTPTPFNTYLNKGLPPHPICNPGKASLKAVFAPLNTKEFYFVANGKGGHEFSESYKQHFKHHKTWRVIRDQ